ncbi:MAG: hypothetical protein ACHQ9S_10770 [Candidatus Binatia bacterium]
MRLFHMALAATVATCVAVPLRAQMSSTMQMGGGSYTTHLVSPMTADTQIGRGMLMISQGMPGMGGMPMMTPGPGANARGLRIRLMLAGVVSQGAPVTSSGNHLYVSASLTSADGSSQPISVDQLFDINAGTAALSVPLTLSSLTLPAVLDVANVEIADTNGKTFGVPGLRMSTVPTQHMTPGIEPHVTRTPGMGGPTMTPGMRPHPMMAPGMGGSTMTPGMGGPRATMTPGMGSHMGMGRQ